MEAIRSSETSILTRATQRHIPEDGILQSDTDECGFGHKFQITKQENCTYEHVSEEVMM
jgi:hypothetical protein